MKSKYICSQIIDGKPVHYRSIRQYLRRKRHPLAYRILEGTGRAIIIALLIPFMVLFKKRHAQEISVLVALAVPTLGGVMA